MLTLHSASLSADELLHMRAQGSLTELDVSHNAFTKSKGDIAKLRSLQVRSSVRLASVR